MLSGDTKILCKNQYLFFYISFQFQLGNKYNKPKLTEILSLILNFSAP